MEQNARIARRRLLTQGGAAALAGIALQSALSGIARAQQIVPGSPTLDTATPATDSADQEQVTQHLATFDRLDFESWNKQDWDLFRQIHSEQVHVQGFGQQTDGIDAHVAWAQAFLKSSPETKVLAHPIRIGASSWTAVTGLLPTATMLTLARWVNGRIAEEYLFSL